MSEICVERIHEDMISDLPNDLLIHILSLLPPQDALNTMVLSKRWRFLWTTVPKLVIDFNFDYTTSLIYKCKTLVHLTLSNNVLVDVPSRACLPSLKSLNLNCVAYKDQESPVKLLSSCPNLRDLSVTRKSGYDYVTRSLVIDSPALRYLKIYDPTGDYRSIQNTPRLGVALLYIVTNTRAGFHPNDTFLKSFSSVRFLDLILNQVACISDINFNRLTQLKLSLFHSQSWLEPLMIFLHNSPVLKVLMINTCLSDDSLWRSWRKPISVPVCLLSHLEIFEWKSYVGIGAEKQFLEYILANSKCLKTVGISSRYMSDDVESMYRVSASSQLLFSTQWRWRSMEN
ncbi:unnamed protein product [Microthlaspi erraticum]|uniref:F-box domain-containing protein n=1 Tax=Microthlaspi erraticum TaxID=1685480 RepID=A0A6D2JME1_9BRAS|nr:unnamed protein product [Microthlaspi erraticum]